MSIRIMSMVWSKAPVQGSELLLLQALADTADDLGSGYPGVPYLATKARMSERSAQRGLRSLERVGLIKIIPNAGPSGVNKYKIEVDVLDSFPDQIAALKAHRSGDRLSPPTNCHRVTNQAQGVTNQAPGGDTGVTLTVINHHNNPQGAQARPRETISEKTISDEKGLRSKARTFSETVSDDNGFDESGSNIPAGNVSAERRAFRKLVKNWPAFEGLSLAKAEREWFALSDDDRAAATEKRDRWIAMLRRNGKDHTPAPSTYLRERLWEAVTDEVETVCAKIAPPFGKAWMVALLDQFQKPPAAMPPAPAYLAKQIEQGTPIGKSEHRSRLALYGWPKANFMLQQALEGKGCGVAPDLLDRLPEMEALIVDSPAFHAWQVHFAERGWPWLKVPHSLKIVWFPKAGPDQTPTPLLGPSQTCTPCGAGRARDFASETGQKADLTDLTT